MGFKGGELAVGLSASINPKEDNALGGRHKAKGKGVGKASQRHKGGHEEDAVCRLLAIKPKR